MRMRIGRKPAPHGFFYHTVRFHTFQFSNSSVVQYDFSSVRIVMMAGNEIERVVKMTRDDLCDYLDGKGLDPEAVDTLKRNRLWSDVSEVE